MIEYLPQAISSLTAAAGIAKTMLGLHDEKLLNTKVIELQQCIIDAQQKVLSGQSEQSAIAKTMEALQAEIARLKDWSAERENWELKQIGHTTFAFVRKDFTGRYGDAQKLCANCFEKGIKSTLQNKVVTVGRNVHLTCPNNCPELSFHYFLEPSTAPPVSS